jgi:alpha-D-xyloside xylohydrolase
MRAQLVGEKPEQGATVSELSNGLKAERSGEVIEVTVCSDSVLHVVAHPASPTIAPPLQPWLLPPAQSCPGTTPQFAKEAQAATLTTAKLKAEFSSSAGNLTFSTAAGDPLLKEGDSEPRTYGTNAKDSTFQITERFRPDATEGLFGLGQHQSGMFNYRGSTVELGQNNTDVAIPLLLSTKGYAILWNTASLTYVDNRFPLELVFRTLAGSSVDYFLIYGPGFDEIIHQYRNLTGHAPMLPKWAYGFFQSKDRYISQEEVLSVAARYRKEHIPLDAIVQDWFWWKTEGDPVFNSNFTDVPAELKTMHDQHIHAMISVWGLLDPKSETSKAMTASGQMVPRANVYDATNPAARDYYWQHLPGKLFDMGWDAFWLDSAEPEESWPHMGDAILQGKQLSIGSGDLYTNVFPLMHTLGVQEHWKAQNSNKRVFLLTRSAFLGQQRVGATVWSGDVYSTYWGLQHQIAAGLNFALSGYPYWTTDIGGYWPPRQPIKFDAAYQELYTRWFQFGVFCPIFRTHGHRPHNEMWTYDQAEPTLIAFDKLRYRLMPYIYSLAGRVSSQDYTIMRPLVMDWREDPQTFNIGDEFMFGPSLLVAPVIKQGAVHRTVYLPRAEAWYDFWTGKKVNGEQEIDASAPLDRIPLYAPAGSILPLGKDIEYAEQSSDPVELRIYPGANGSLDLYEDEGDNYNYEHGSRTIIPLRWNNEAHTLVLGARQGSFPGMPPAHHFNIVLVDESQGIGAEASPHFNQSIEYDGHEQTIRVAQ